MQPAIGKRVEGESGGQSASLPAIVCSNLGLQGAVGRWRVQVSFGDDCDIIDFVALPQGEPEVPQ